MSPPPHADPEWLLLAIVGFHAFAVIVLGIWGEAQRRRRLRAEQRLEGIREVLHAATDEEGSEP